MPGMLLKRRLVNADVERRREALRSRG